MYWFVRASLALASVLTVVAVALPGHTIDGG